jgi:5-formyltetrahydrofolate cyclo-ligase
LQRAALTWGQRRRAAQRIARILATSPRFHGRKRIALYMAAGTEPDTRLLLAIARRRGLQVCLPRIRNYPRRVMDFIADGGGRRPNRHGIPEPVPGMHIPVRSLDVVVLPALAFDRRGTRLGTGGGYYDRALAHLAGLPPDRRPWLIGISYACNEMPMLAAAPHDVPLDQIATELELIDCHRRRPNA